MSLRTGLTLVAILLGFTGCGSESHGPPPNVLIITLDTLRPDRLGLHGYERDTSPNLDAFAEESIVFDEAFSNSSFTPPSHGSILTGLFPSEHGLTHWSQHLADVPTAGDLFGAAGYRTIAITPMKSLYLIGLKRGFETALLPPETYRRGLTLLADAETINADVLPRLTDGEDDRPFFAWLHYYDAHRVFGRQGREWAQRFNDRHDLRVGSTEQWYQLRETPWQGRFAQGALSPEDIAFIEDRYDGGLAYLDRQLGALFDGLREAGVLDDTIVIVTADHGEAFAEHGEEWFTHDRQLVDEIIHVPLLIRLPGGAKGGRRVDELVQGVDLLPTVLELSRIPAPGWEGSGLSLVPTFGGRSLGRDAVFADRMGADWFQAPPLHNPRPTATEVLAERDRRRMVRTATHKMIVNEDRRTVSVFENGREGRNLYDPEDGVTRELQSLYERQIGQLDEVVSKAVEISEEMRQQLASLGYLGSAVGPAELEPLTAAPDDSDGTD